MQTPKNQVQQINNLKYINTAECQRALNVSYEGVISDVLQSDIDQFCRAYIALARKTLNRGLMFSSKAIESIQDEMKQMVAKGTRHMALETVSSDYITSGFKITTDTGIHFLKCKHYQSPGNTFATHVGVHVAQDAGCKIVDPIIAYSSPKKEYSRSIQEYIPDMTSISNAMWKKSVEHNHAKHQDLMTKDPEYATLYYSQLAIHNDTERINQLLKTAPYHNHFPGCTIEDMTGGNALLDMQQNIVYYDIFLYGESMHNIVRNKH